MGTEFWGGEDEGLTLAMVEETARLAYEARCKEALSFAPFDVMWAHQAAKPGEGLLSGDPLGKLTIDEVKRWAEAQALFTRAAYFNAQARSAQARGDTELRMLFYAVGDRLGVTQETPSAIDPAAGVMRRAVRQVPAATVERPSTRIVRGTP